MTPAAAASPAPVWGRFLRRRRLRHRKHAALVAARVRLVVASHLSGDGWERREEVVVVPHRRELGAARRRERRRGRRRGWPGRRGDRHRTLANLSTSASAAPPAPALPAP